MKNIWNKIFIAIGVLSIISGLGNLNERTVTMVNSGIIIIIASIAYKSALKRKNKEVKNTNLRLGIELSGILIIFLMIVMQNNLLFLIETDPFPNFLIPIIAIASYLFRAIKK